VVVRCGSDSGSGVANVEISVYNLRYIWESERGRRFHLFFYSPRGRGIRVYGSCRARGIANILGQRRLLLVLSLIGLG
jgi:hypothetical protein